jgi:uncharacterized protein (DUF2336 family)
MAGALPNSIADLGSAAMTASPERGERVFKQLTSLFLSNADRFGEAEIGALDDALAGLIEKTEAGSLAELSEALSKKELVPLQTIRRLAFHADAKVACPVLRSSTRLEAKDLIEIAATLGQQHLLAISERKLLNEALTDVLLRRGDANVSTALARNPGAVFSECGYATLVGRAERDEGLLEKLGLRLDMPAILLRELLVMATDVVRARFLTAPRPVAKAARSGETAPAKVRPKVDYKQALDQVGALARTGKLTNSAVNRFAVGGEYTNVVAALALKADVKPELIEPFIESDRLYALIVACKAARLDWSVAMMIVRNRPNCPPVNSEELAQCREIFDGLLLSIAQWTVRFKPDRI